MIKVENDADYRLAKGFSNSELKDFRKSFGYWLYKKNTPIERTKPMILGTVIHEAILEPHKQSYVVKSPNLDLRTKEGKAWKFAQGDKLIIDESEQLMIDEIIANIKAHPIANSLVFSENTMYESSLYWEDEGISCKAKMDIYNPETHIADIKTCESIQKFMKDIRYNDGDRQAGWYSYGEKIHSKREKPLPFYWIAVERQAPYEVAVFTISKDNMLVAYRENIRDCKKLTECINNNNNGVAVVSYPEIEEIYFR